MNYTEIEIEWMKELLKENELEIWRLRKDIKNLKEERDFFKEQATLWRNDYKNEYEKNKKLRNLKILWKTVEERIEIDKGVVRVKD